MEREILAVHKGENCPKRIVTCEYCEFPLPAIDLFEHQVYIPTITALNFFETFSPSTLHIYLFLIKGKKKGHLDLGTSLMVDFRLGYLPY